MNKLEIGLRPPSDAESLEEFVKDYRRTFRTDIFKNDVRIGDFAPEKGTYFVVTTVRMPGTPDLVAQWRNHREGICLYGQASDPSYSYRPMLAERARDIFDSLTSVP